MTTTELKTYAAHLDGRVFEETWLYTLVAGDDETKPDDFPGRVREHPALGKVLFESGVHVRTVPEPSRVERTQLEVGSPDGEPATSDESVVSFYDDDSPLYELWSADYLDGWSAIDQKQYRSMLGNFDS